MISRIMTLHFKPWLQLSLRRYAIKRTDPLSLKGLGEIKPRRLLSGGDSVINIRTDENYPPFRRTGDVFTRGHCFSIQQCGMVVVSTAVINTRYFYSRICLWQ